VGVQGITKKKNGLAKVEEGEEEPAVMMVVAIMVMKKSEW
jgi:hypothetical protein